MKVSIHNCKSLFFVFGLLLAWIHCVLVLGLAGMGQLSFSLALAGFFAGILRGSRHQKKFSWSFQGAQFVLMSICCVVYLIVSLFFQSLSQSLIFLPMLFGLGLVPAQSRPFQDLIGIGIILFFLTMSYTQIRYTNDVALAALLLSNWFFFDALVRAFPLPSIKVIALSSIQKELKKQGQKILISLIESLLITGPIFICGLTRPLEEAGLLASLMLIAGIYIYWLEKIPLSLRREINHLICFLGLGLGLCSWNADFKMYEMIGHLFWLFPGLLVLNRQVLQKHKLFDHNITMVVLLILGAGSMILVPLIGIWGTVVSGLAGLVLMSVLVIQKFSFPSQKEIAKVFPCLVGALFVWISSPLLTPSLWGQCGLILIYLLIAVGGQMVIVRSKW